MNLKDNAEKNRVFFNEKIEEYDESHIPFMKTKKELADNIPSNAKTVLDLGVGTGLELFEVYKRFPDLKVTAIDISEKMLEKLKERDFSKNIKTIQGSFFDVDFGDNYDAVISTSALHHFLKEDKLVLYKKIYESLKEGALFINADKIVDSIEEENERIEKYHNDYLEKPHIDVPLTIEHEILLLKEAGFKDINVSEVDKSNYRLFKSLKKDSLI